jgi:acetate kinase
VEKMLNHDAGLKALGGINDMRELRLRAAQGHEQARLAIRVFCRSVVKAIAGFVALYGADALVFTGGIGEHDADSRAEIGSGLAAFGVKIDVEANALKPFEADLTQEEVMRSKVRKISDGTSAIAVYVIPAQEDLMIARHVAHMCGVSLPDDGLRS